MTKTKSRVPKAAVASPAVRDVEELDESREELRGSGRAAMGVTGDRQTRGFFSELKSVKVGIYPLTALGLLVIVDQFQATVFQVQGPEIGRALGVPRGVVALLLLLRTLALVFAALPIAAVVQNHPRRALVAKATGIGWGAATLLTGFVVQPLQMAGILSLDGATSGSVGAVHQPLLIDSYPTSVRTRVLSVYTAFAQLGGVLVPLTVALLAGPLEFTWRGVFIVTGVISLIVSLYALRLKDPGFGRFDTARVREAVAGETSANGLSDRDFQLGFFEIMRSLLLIPTLRRIFFVGAALGMLALPVGTYFSFYLDQRWGLDASQRALVFTAVAVLSVFVLVLLSRRGESYFQRDPAELLRITAGLVLACVVLIVISVLSPVLWGTIAAFSVALAVLAVATPFLFTCFLSIVRPNMRPHSAALFNIFQVGVGGTAGILLLSGADTRYGLTAAIVMTCVPGFFAALLLLGAAKTVNDDLDRTVDGLIEETELTELTARGQRLPMLACRKVDFSYGHLQVLFGIDFTVDDGEAVALLGTNGAGKSTLLRVISGLGLPSRGTVRFRGGDITFLDTERRVGLGITQVPSGHAVFPPLSVVENLRMHGYIHGRDRRVVDSGIEASFDAFPRLGERRNQAASTLSGGEQQMLGLSKALIMKPRILLIDELSLGLAPKIVGELLALVRRINADGTAIVLVEQSVNVALSAVNHAYFMEKGEIRFDGKADELRERADLLRSVFLQGASKGLETAGRTSNGRTRRPRPEK